MRGYNIGSKHRRTRCVCVCGGGGGGAGAALKIFGQETSAPNETAPVRKFAIPNRSALYFSEVTWVENNIQSLYGVNSDGINRSVHCVHYILEQKKSHENSTSEIRTHDTWAWRAGVWCLTHRANTSDANGRCIFVFYSHSSA